MTEEIAFTKKIIEALPPAASRKRSYYRDQRTPDLWLSVTSAGTKSFFAYKKVAGNPVRVTLGKYPDMTIDAARKELQLALADIVRGINPNDVKKAARAAGITVRQAFDDYIANRNLKALTKIDYENVLNETCKDWWNKPISSISRDMVRAKHRKRGEKSHARANNAMRVLRAIINHAIEITRDSKGISSIGHNPVQVLSRTKSWYVDKRKSTFISETDLRKWLDAVVELESDTTQATGPSVSRLLRFCLFTGVRRSEALRLKWSDIDLAAATFVLRETKNGLTVQLPLPKYVSTMLASAQADSACDYVFSNAKGDGAIIEPEKMIKRIARKTGVSFTLHDLRRTFLTIGESLDINILTLKRLVNHKSGDRSEVTAGYIIRHVDRLRRASDQIAARITLIWSEGHAEQETGISPGIHLSASTPDRAIEASGAGAI